MNDMTLPRRPAAETPPLIGVSACRRPLETTPFFTHSAGEKYLAAVIDGAGGCPVILPALGQAGLDLALLVDRLDGLMLTGSPSNVEPHHYSDEENRTPDKRDPERDATTLPLIRAAIAAGVPVLAICRGIQELNVALGGSLHQQLHEVEGKRDHRSDKTKSWEERYAPAHPVRVAGGGALARLIGRDGEIVVNSLHAQGIDRLAPGLAVEAVAEDGTIEAVSLPGARAFVMGVQWHAEWQCLANPVSRALFAAFGDAARRRARSRAGRAPVAAS
jgi:putative glutamine amidotransferase